MTSGSFVASTDQGSSSTVRIEEDGPPVANYPIIPRDELELCEQLGAGAYGSVYLGKWKTKGKVMTVALKKVFMLEKEADILSRIRHRNIIQFYGVSKTDPDFFIVTEFAEGGSLYDYLHNPENPDLDFQQIISWAIQIASGVAYLHYEAPETIIHRDLKSKNIVLTGEHICKLCDFGTSKNLTHSWTEPSWGGTAAWMSPEIILQNEGITTATDVWSYAVVLWEMISREVPYKGLTEFCVYSLIAQKGVTLVIPEKCPSAFACLMKSCWKVNPKERYTMHQVIDALNAMRVNAELSKECGHFLKHKDEWKCEIEQQLEEIEAQKIDFAIKMGELSRRENALKKREATQRGKYGEEQLEGDVALWDEEQVCQWIRQICKTLAVKNELLDHMIASVLHHNINGNRLLDVTQRDLECLGICSLGVRSNLYNEVVNLRRANDRMKNFPSLQVSYELDRKKKLEKQSPPLSLSLILHLTSYTRPSDFESHPNYRYKILLDTDWDQRSLGDRIPDDLYHSQVLVKNICISILCDDTSVKSEPYRCDSYPFTMSEWIDSPMRSSEVEIVCAICYTDRVIRPRTTCIRTKLNDFSRPQTLENKRVQVVVRSYPSTPSNRSRHPSSASIERSSSSHPLSADSQESGTPSILQGVWHNRATSSGSIFGRDTSTDSPSPVLSQKAVTKSPLWANIAAGLMSSPSQSLLNTQQSTSSYSGSDLSFQQSVSRKEMKPAQLLREKIPIAQSRTISLSDYLRNDSVLVNPVSKVHDKIADERLSRTKSRRQTTSKKPSGTMVQSGRRRPPPIIIPKLKFQLTANESTSALDGGDQVSLLDGRLNDMDLNKELDSVSIDDERNAKRSHDSQTNPEAQQNDQCCCHQYQLSATETHEEKKREKIYGGYQKWGWK
ncbi:unnamed protein product [Anisakis simplex]|uniref:Mitogen-activated protein kinase kinase kinase 20 n=1 Tax=Anisakis simplex TaxID=6269 RepID=A0A0M3JYD8_ANISI|nr:unnamed protein product [Anisakis simplex]